jgi:hypothetical protein
MVIEIVAECANGFEAVKAADECKPDLRDSDGAVNKG